MLCSNCSEKITPIVSIDIDGTLGDYHSHLLRFASHYLGWTYPVQSVQYTGSKPMREWFCEYFNVDERTWRDIKLAYRQGAQKRSMPVTPGASGLTYKIRALGAEVWLCTTRPYMRLDGIDPDTRFWLEKHDIVYDHLLYDEDKYQQLANNVDKDRVAAVMDDLPEDLQRASQLFGPSICILMRGEHNRALWDAYSGSQLVHDSQAAFQKIEPLVRRWKNTYDHEGSDPQLIPGRNRDEGGNSAGAGSASLPFASDWE